MSTSWRVRIIWSAVGFVVAVIVIVIANGLQSQWLRSTEDRGSSTPAVDTESPSETDTGVRPECYIGVVLARESVAIAAEIESRIEEVAVRVGDQVGSGQLIARLDNRNLVNQYKMERTALRTAEANRSKIALEADRARHEHERRAALGELLSDEEKEVSKYQSQAAALSLEVAEAELAQVQTRVEQLESLLARCEIRAPFDGTISARYLNAGALVSAGTPIVQLISSSKLMTRFAVPPEDAESFIYGTEIRVEVMTNAAVLSGTVDRHAPEIDAAAQMVFVQASLHLDEGIDNVPSGAAVRVSKQQPGVAQPSCLN